MTAEAAEKQIPRLARQAFAQAHTEALEAGLSVLVRSGNSLVRIHPDGRRERVSSVAPKVKVKRGARYVL